MIEVAVPFTVAIICAGVLAILTLRRDIRAIRVVVNDIDDQLATLESRQGGSDFSDVLVGDTFT